MKAALVFAAITLAPSASLAQYNSGGYRPYYQPQPQQGVPYSTPQPTPNYLQQRQVPNGPTVVHYGNQPHLCNTYAGVTQCP